MEPNISDSIVVCKNSEGLDIQAQVVRLNRYGVVFEVYNPYGILQISEVLQDFQIYFGDRIAYSGSAVVGNLVNTGIMLVCEATLEENWIEQDQGVKIEWLDGRLSKLSSIENQFNRLLDSFERVERIESDYKVLVSDLKNLLLELRNWLDQLEAQLGTKEEEDRNESEAAICREIQRILEPKTNQFLQKLELFAEKIAKDEVLFYKRYLRKELHPIVLCAPFLHRTFTKPLGYAGDYEMVNMMLGNPYQGGSLFAKLVNQAFVNTAPAVAHRNRIVYLEKMLVAEASRKVSCGKKLKVFNLGCGPAMEIQRFLRGHQISDQAEITLVDFNRTTVEYTQSTLEKITQQHSRTASLQFHNYSVQKVLKMASSSRNQFPENHFELVYCAGLFDYLTNNICQRLVEFLYKILAPGGLCILTNVHPSNPIKIWMSFILEWHLIYRDERQLRNLVPRFLRPESIDLLTDPTGVNLYMELRKPKDGCID